MKIADKNTQNSLDLGQILDSAALFPPQPCIYYLINSRNEVVYVGQTLNLYASLLEHRKKGVNFVRFRYFTCAESDLERLERGAIERLDPILNRVSKSRSVSAPGNLSKPFICLKYNITPVAFERLREAFELQPASSFGNAKYYKPEDVEAWVRRFKGLVVSGRHVLQAKPTYLAVGISSRTKQIQLFTK
ncbi:GIY-YIG nuclease family protein [Spirosoma linguale]|uniref:Excinuclease ABC C subunit domain protein n=1 Tax=Spirosoma linguale (strain ATCC 33905 / DSM 74 / LMG 10896 / Claus 1) TaxID=504472 RepID=D2QLD1_SPILD|nr:Excinuclease ABC C subunit domain protein [Spirosoma linguale DSM 74]